MSRRVVVAGRILPRAEQPTSGPLIVQPSLSWAILRDVLTEQAQAANTPELLTELQEPPC